MDSVVVEDRHTVDRGAHHLIIFKVTVVALGTSGQLDIIHIQDELVAAVEVTDSDVLLTSVGTQVNSVVVPVTLSTSSTTTAIARDIATALCGHRPFLNHRPVARTVVGDSNTEVIGRIVGILSASPEAEGATSSKGHLR